MVELMGLFLPGPMEIIIVLLVLGFLIGLVLLVLSALRQRPSSNANLTTYPDCGNQVSLNAASCPKCGSPLTKT